GVSGGTEEAENDIGTGRRIELELRIGRAPGEPGCRLAPTEHDMNPFRSTGPAELSPAVSKKHTRFSSPSGLSRRDDDWSASSEHRPGCRRQASSIAHNLSCV